MGAIVRFSFVIPLFVALVSTYIYRKVDDEISYLTGSVIAICILLSIILAPWELQVVILAIAIILAKSLWSKIEQQREEDVEGNSPPPQD